MKYMNKESMIFFGKLNLDYEFVTDGDISNFNPECYKNIFAMK